jgi:hypothetical protein
MRSVSSDLATKMPRVFPISSLRYIFVHRIVLDTPTWQCLVSAQVMKRLTVARLMISNSTHFLFAKPGCVGCDVCSAAVLSHSIYWFVCRLVNVSLLLRRLCSVEWNGRQDPRSSYEWNAVFPKRFPYSQVYVRLRNLCGVCHNRWERHMDSHIRLWDVYFVRIE